MTWSQVCIKQSWAPTFFIQKFSQKIQGKNLTRYIILKTEDIDCFNLSCQRQTHLKKKINDSPTCADIIAKIFISMEKVVKFHSVSGKIH